MASAIATVSCGDDDANSGQTTPTPPTAAAPAAQPTATTVQNSLPSELAGDWHTLISADDPVTLTLGSSSYRIERGPAVGSGRLASHGTELDFSGSASCEGQATYRWSIQDGELHLAAVAPDPCPRAEVLDNHTYTRGKAP